MLKHFEGTFSLGVLMDELIESMPVTFDKKQEVLEAVDLNTRYQVLAKILYEEIEVAKIRTELSEQVKARMEKNQKEYMLREQMNYIREELGEDNVMSDAEQFQQELNKLKAGKEVKEKYRRKSIVLRAWDREAPNPPWKEAIWKLCWSCHGIRPLGIIRILSGRKKFWRGIIMAWSR